MPDQLQLVYSNIVSLGARRLLALAGAALAVLLLVGGGAYYLNRPAYETLYVGLERGDVSRIGIVLGEAGVSYDVDSSGTSILVPVGSSSSARMILAEKGLPTSSGAGYELFDNLGSLGLTSFMQEVTRVRALEGEIARSIQTINGVKAARVHIVMSESGNFRRQERKPTASVIVRTNGSRDNRIAYSIRHLVAAAVPGLSSENVTVLDASGRLMAAGEDPLSNMLTSNMSIEHMIEKQISENIRRALTPYLGADNFRTSIRTDINTDRKQIEETIFDPDSRIERSVQVVKTEESASQESGAEPVTVEQALPGETEETGSGPQSTENRERREETTNYELSSKKIATVSSGYTVEKMSIAVVINRARLTEVLGANATAAQIAERISEIRNVVATTAGFDEARGDAINITAVEFLAPEDLQPAAATSIFADAGKHVGTAINALAFIAVALLVLFLGIKPLIRAIGEIPPPAATQTSENTAAMDQLEADADLSEIASDDPSAPLRLPPGIEEETDDLLSRMKQMPQERLEAIVDLDEERSAQVLRNWAFEAAA
ncbi:MAG: flagellar basal-body MS-ring/collar protein FliF [Rhizobiaceae bacterium]